MTNEVQQEGETKETPEAQRRRGAVSRWVGRIAGATAAVVLLLTLLAYLGESAWWLDVLNQGRMQYLTWSLVLVVILLLARAWPWLTVALVAAAINAWLVAWSHRGSWDPLWGRPAIATCD